jgi:hypothetical protein
MNNPIDIKYPLQPFFVFGIGVGLSAKTGTSAPKGTVESFAVVCMNVFVLYILQSIRMLRTGGLILGSFATSFSGLGTLVLDPHLCPFFEGLTGTSFLAGMENFMANLKQDVSVPTLSIRNQGKVPGSVNESPQCLEGFPEQIPIFPAAFKLPEKPTGPVHKYHRPTDGLIRGQVFPNPGIDLIPFDDELKEVVEQGIEQEDIFNFGKTVLPVEYGVLCDLEDSAHRIQSQSLGSDLDNSNDETEGFSESDQKSVDRLGKIPPALSAMVYRPLPMVLGQVESVRFQFLAPTIGAGNREQFHDGFLLEDSDKNQRKLYGTIYQFYQVVLVSH